MTVLAVQEGCAVTDPGCLIGNVISQAASDAVTQMANNTAEAFGQVMASFGTYWLYVPTPNLVSGRSGSNGDVVLFIQNNLLWITGMIVVAALVFAGIRTMLTARAQPLRQAARGLAALIAVTALAVPVLGLLISFGDSFSVWFVNQALDGGDFGANLEAAMIALVAMPGGALVVIIVGVIAIVTALVQVVLMLIRMVMLVLLAGMFPVAASAAGSETGWAFLKKYAGWVLAFLLYKPVAAVIYGTAFALIANGLIDVDEGGGSVGITLDEYGTNVWNMVAGTALMLLSVVALGALMKFVVPAIGAIGSSSMGGAAAAGVGAAATGAVSVAGTGRGFGGAAGSGGAPSTPSGAGAAPAGAAAAGGSGAAAGTSAAGGAGAASGAAAGSAGGPIGMAVGAAASAAGGKLASASAAAKGAATDAVESGSVDG